MVSDWGGMTFLLPYVLFVVLIASTGVIEEMALGRAAKSGPIRAFGKCTEIRTGNKRTGEAVSYTHLRAHETDSYLVCRLLLEKKKKTRICKTMSE